MLNAFSAHRRVFLSWWCKNRRNPERRARDRLGRFSARRAFRRSVVKCGKRNKIVPVFLRNIPLYGNMVINMRRGKLTRYRQEIEASETENSHRCNFTLRVIFGILDPAERAIASYSRYSWSFINAHSYIRSNRIRKMADLVDRSS